MYDKAILNGCVPYIDNRRPGYGYVPSSTVGIVMCVLFGASMLLHIFQSTRKRQWWALVFATGALGKYFLH